LPEIMAVSAGGAIEWKRTVPCNASELLATMPNQIVFSCEDRSLHGLTGGNEMWKKVADGMLYSDMLVDRSGAVYYGDYGRESGVIHMHAIDSRGKDLWTIDMERASVSNMALDAKRRLYVAGSFATSRLVCLGD
jgi:outer membrane protein assembly factor BamB